MVQPKTPPLSVRLPGDLLERLTAEAARRGVSRNSLIAEAIEALLSAKR